MWRRRLINVDSGSGGALLRDLDDLVSIVSSRVTEILRRAIRMRFSQIEIAKDLVANAALIV